MTGPIRELDPAEKGTNPWISLLIVAGLILFVVALFIVADALG